MPWRWGWLTLHVDWKRDIWPTWPWIEEHHISVRLLPWPVRAGDGT